MNIVICGGGEVGSHAAEELTRAGSAVTLIDADEQKLRAITDTMDVRTLVGNAASAEILREAGAADADLLVAATNSDEVNLVASAVGRALGAAKSLARVHHSTFLNKKSFDYEKHFGISELLCPEFTTASAIARTLRNPAALAIEEFAGGRIDMHELPISDEAPATGRPLAEVKMPARTRLAAVLRKTDVFLPDGETVLSKGDRVVLVANRDVFDEARAMFRAEKPTRKSVVLLGGTPMCVWLCEALRERVWSIRVFETNRPRAEHLAERLPWVTVLSADPTDKGVFAEERIALADVFVGLLDDDEDNIVGSVMAKAGGVSESIAVVQQSRYMDLLYHIGIDHAYSPGMVAAREITNLLDDSPIRRLAALATGIDAYQIRVQTTAPVNGQVLRRIQLSPNWVLGAIRRNDEVWVPGADDVVQGGDIVLLIGKHGEEQQLEELFLGK